MAQDRWRQIKMLFQAALEQPPAERSDFLGRQCSDEGMRAEVVKLLGLHEGSPEFLETPIGSPGVPVANDPLIGQRLGDYLILRRIGAGGMGIVYEARQEQPRRLAAVKVVRPGVATPQRLRRFEYESEVLAKLQHPGIATIYAAGSFDLGDGPQPWFAMELICGQTLNNCVKERVLSLRQKIELLLRVCDGVQYAHQQGVIHRDLKPANILVVDEGIQGLRDSGIKERGNARNSIPQTLNPLIRQSLTPSIPQPKILDFGVARVIGSDAIATMHTTAGELVGTLSYMSPEQLSANADDMDGRSDVYALGVIGYEMLSGRLPYERNSTAADVIRSIAHDDPPRLGTIDRTLRGDLETILGKALEKDQSRRYQSAGELAADLGRYLNNEPVLARPATPLYRFRKFARRNRALVAGVLATILALAAGTVVYAMEAQRARQEAAQARYEADKATAINNFITNDFLMKLLAAANADDGQRLPVAELVDRAAEQIGVMFVDQPLAEAAVRNEVGSIYYNLGAFDKAGQEFRLALERWNSRLGADHPDTLKAVNNLGQTLLHLQQTDEAEALYRRALDGRLRVLGEDDPYTLISMNNLAELLRSTKRLDEAEVLFKRTLELQRRVQGEAHKNTLTTMANLGTLLLDRGKKDEALRLHRQAFETSRKLLGADHVTTLVAGSRLGQTLRSVGELAEAETLLADIVRSCERTLGSEHGSTITTRRALARVYTAQGKREQATEQLRLALEGIRAKPERSGQLERAVQKELDTLTESQPAAPAPRP